LSARRNNARDLRYLARGVETRYHGVIDARVFGQRRRTGASVAWIAVGEVKIVERRVAFGWTITLFAAVIGPLTAAWIALYLQGKRFALRDRLRRADAIVAVAGTLGNIEFLNGKTDTAVRLYRAGWAPIILFAGRFSHAVASHAPHFMSPAELESAVHAGRIDPQTAADAMGAWDVGLGAEYMRDRALRAGMPAAAILTEDASLHTLENARFSVQMLVERGVRSVILVAAPFHQLRAWLTFAKVYGDQGIEVLSYTADTNGWRPWTWFLSAENRRLVHGETQRIRTYQAKGDLLTK
jgi:uncharacterized SAM-binding protein YcdF (DUF218 family)